MAAKFETITEKAKEMWSPTGDPADAEEIEVEQTRQIPAAPRNTAKTFLVRFAVVLTAISVMLSVVAITKLGFPMAGWGAVALAAFWDGGWVWALVAEWDSRFHPADRMWARVLGVLTAAGAVASVFYATWLYGGAHAHGLAYVLAAFPATSKGFWAWLMHRYTPRLSTKSQDWFNKRADRASATVALEQARAELTPAPAELEPAPVETVTVERDTEAEQEAERLARKVRKQAKEIKRLSRAQPVAQLGLSLADPAAQPMEHVGRVGSAGKLAQRSDLRVEPSAQPFGFAAQPSAQVAERLSRVAQAAELLAAQPELTGAQLAQRLGVSLASAKRYATEARNHKKEN